MAVTTILVESHNDILSAWSDYVLEYNQEVSKTSALDLVGLGQPQRAENETLEQVLNIMTTEVPAATPDRVALIYAHANEDGFIMRITQNAASAQADNLRGLSRAWKALDEMIAIRKAVGQPQPIPPFIELFKKLTVVLRDLVNVEKATFVGKLPDPLPDPTTVTSRETADAWFKQWLDSMAKICLGTSGFTEADLRRVCYAMQQVRDLKYDRVEIRGCHIGKDKATLDVLREIFGTKQVIAPKVTCFSGETKVHSNQNNFALLEKHLGGFHGTTFVKPDQQKFILNQMPRIHVESQLVTGRRNRVFSTSAGDVIMQQTETSPFHFSGRIWAPSDAALVQFFQANYKSTYVFRKGRTSQPMGGFWLGHVSTAVVPFLLPLEPNYRDFLEISP